MLQLVAAFQQWVVPMSPIASMAIVAPPPHPHGDGGGGGGAPLDYFRGTWAHIDQVPGFAELKSDVEKFEKLWGSRA